VQPGRPSEADDYLKSRSSWAGFKARRAKAGYFGWLLTAPIGSVRVENPAVPTEPFFLSYLRPHMISPFSALLPPLPTFHRFHRPRYPGRVRLRSSINISNTKHLRGWQTVTMYGFLMITECGSPAVHAIRKNSRHFASAQHCRRKTGKRGQIDYSEV
jgi:hypothetical protein